MTHWWINTLFCMPKVTSTLYFGVWCTHSISFTCSACDIVWCRQVKIHQPGLLWLVITGLPLSMAQGKTLVIVVHCYGSYCSREGSYCSPAVSLRYTLKYLDNALFGMFPLVSMISTTCQGILFCDFAHKDSHDTCTVSSWYCMGTWQCRDFLILGSLCRQVIASHCIDKKGI